MSQWTVNRLSAEPCRQIVAQTLMAPEPACRVVLAWHMANRAAERNDVAPPPNNLFVFIRWQSLICPSLGVCEPHARLLMFTIYSLCARHPIRSAIDRPSLSFYIHLPYQGSSL